MPRVRPRCDLCRAPAVWLAIDVGGATPLCDQHRHAAAYEIEPLPPATDRGPERLGAIVERMLNGRVTRRRNRDFRPDR